jgi:ATP-binding cassette subfamily C protein
MIQQNINESGALSLAIILAYYGTRFSFEELLMDCNVLREGNNAENILQVAKNLGYTAEIVQASFDELKMHVYPLILQAIDGSFFVLEGFDLDEAYINDPATGPRVLKYKELEKLYSGNALLIHPPEAYIPEEKQLNFYDQLVWLLKPSLRSVIFILVASLCLIIPNLALAALIKVFVDKIFLGEKFSWVFNVLMGMTLITVSISFLAYLKGAVLNRLNIRLSASLNSQVFWKMLQMPMNYYTHTDPGEIAYRISLCDTICNALTSNLANIIVNVLLAVIFGLVIVYFDVAVALAAFFVTTINFAVIFWVYRSRRNLYALHKSEDNKTTSFSISGLGNIESIKSMGTEGQFFSYWAGYYTKGLITWEKIGRMDSILATLPELLGALADIVLVGVGGWRIINGRMSVGMFLAIFVLLRYFVQPVIALAQTMETIQMLKIYLAQIYELLKVGDEETISFVHEQEHRPVAKLQGYVQMENVQFSYSPTDRNVIDSFYLSLAPGKSVALVGTTGCGKSTIAKLISALYKPTKGVILFDGLESFLIPTASRIASISLIEQEPFMFRGSARDNLTLLDSNVTQEDVVKAAKDACIHDEILERNGGYDFIVEDNGINLSTGQKQRFEIARGLIKNPVILIIDEATSSIDAETEEVVVKNVLRRGCSILIIAHKVTTIKICDEIVVMDQGKIIAKGTHDELMDVCDVYRQMLESEKIKI